MRLYGLKNCDKCRLAKKNYGLSAIIDVREDPINDDILARAIAEFGDSIVNRASTTWRGLTEAERGMDTFSLLKAHPALMKRPLIVHDDGEMTVGKIAP
jgi:arsenate reductase